LTDIQLDCGDYHIIQFVGKDDTDIDAVSCGLGQVGMEVGRAGSSAANLSHAALSIPQEIFCVYYRIEVLNGI
jgi:hypothetical protein